MILEKTLVVRDEEKPSRESYSLLSSSCQRLIIFLLIIKFFICQLFFDIDSLMSSVQTWSFREMPSVRVRFYPDREKNRKIGAVDEERKVSNDK